MATEKNNGSKKWDAAVDKARGVDGDAGGDAGNVDVGGAGAMIAKFNPDDLANMAKSGEWEFAPQLKSLEEGDMIAGVLEGYGPGAEFESKDPHTGEILTRHVNTWILSSPDKTQRASILSSAQLDRKLPPFIGDPVRIIRGKDIKTSNNFKVADYIVAGPASKDGVKREWASKKPTAALDGTRYVEPSKALPAGAEVPPPVANDVQATAPAVS